MDVPKFDADKIKPKKRSRKKERTFLTELKKSFKACGSFFYKIADLPHFPGSGFRFDLEKPFDAFVVWHSIPIAIEAKSMDGYKAFGSQVRPSQIKGLNNFIRHGGRGFIFLNIRSAAPQRINRLIILDWKTLRDRISEGNTIKKKELEALPYIDGSKQRFRLRSWLKSL